MIKERKLNILFLSSWYPNRVAPTLGNFVQRHAEAAALKCNVVALFVCADASCKQNFEITEQIINNVYTINVYYKKVESSVPILSTAQKLFRFMRGYYQAIITAKKRMKKIDLVHHNVLYPVGIIALFLKYVMGIPYIVSEHWTGYLPVSNNYKGFLKKMITKTIANNASCLIPVSKNLQIAMKNHGFKYNYAIVPNVVDIKLFYPRLTKSKDGKIKLLHVSTLNDEQKNISGILRTISVLTELRSDFEILFISDGDIITHIKKAKELGIYQTIAFFDGTKTTIEIAELMRNADCLVLFSNYENLPCVTLEAMACGIPIVSSEVGEIPEHINDTFGILIKPMDEEALLNSLNKMIENIKAKKYNAQKLSDYAKTHFSYEKVSEQFLSLYKKNINE